MEKKKVLFLITKSNWGGAQRYVFDLATNLPAEIEPVVALGGNGPLAGKLNEAGIRTVPLKSLSRDISLLKELRLFFEISHLLRQERPAIFHVNSSKAGGAGALLGRIHHVPLTVFTAHGWAFNEDRPKWQKLLIKFFHWLTVVLAHHTIAVSIAVKAQMNWPFAQNKITVIHPGRAPIAFFERTAARDTLGDSTPVLRPYFNDVWIGTIAELHPIKQLERMVDVMAVLTKEYPTLRYVIIGDGGSRQSLERKISDLSLQEQVFLVGAITEAGRYLHAFDYFVLPSQSESFGYVLLEASQAGLPIVATDVGGIPDIIESGVNGLLVPADDTPALRVAIESLLNDELLRKKVAHAATENARRFTLENMVSKTNDFYSANMPLA